MRQEQEATTSNLTFSMLKQSSKFSQPSTFILSCCSFIFICLWSIFCPKTATAQLHFSDSVRISLLTVSPGPIVYERWGHTALRIKDLRKKNQDIVFHYGVFNFNAPNFVYRFLKGETDYRLGALYYSGFEDDYRNRGLRMIEQELNLTPKQSAQIVEKLLINYRPENRVYRYSYFYDNCATRPFHLIENATEGIICYDTTYAAGSSLRDLLREKTGYNTWLDFGVSLIVAQRADRQSSFAERMFLPEYLMQAYSMATISATNHTDTSLSPLDTTNTPLVKSERTLLERDEAITAYIEASPAFSPTTAAWLLFLITIIVTVIERKWRRRITLFDTLLLITAGLAGVMVWFLNFLSVHPALDQNINCLWLWPTHIIFAILIWIKSCKKAVFYYFFINFAALIVYIVLSLYGFQYAHPAFYPIVLALAIRSLSIVTQRFNQ